MGGQSSRAESGARPGSRTVSNRMAHSPRRAPCLAAPTGLCDVEVRKGPWRGNKAAGSADVVCERGRGMSSLAEEASVGRVLSAFELVTVPSPITSPTSPPNMSSDSAPAPTAASTNPRVFFDMSIGGKPAGKIVFELFADVVPKTVSSTPAWDRSLDLSS